MVRLTDVKVNEVLSWRKQVNSCVGKAMSNFNQMSRYKRFLNQESKIKLCESIVLSQFNYCDVVYSNLDQFLKNKIQKIQNLCIKFIFDLRRKDHCDYNFFRKQLKWLDMNQRRVKHGLTLIYKILHGLAPNYLADSFCLVNEIHSVNTRSSRNNDIWINKYASSKVHQNSYSVAMSKIYNRIPEEIKKCTSVNSFKKRIGELLLNNGLVIA